MIKRLGLAIVVAGTVTGCGGLATTQTFSPLMFFLPGLAATKPVPPQIVPVVKDTPPAQVVAFRSVPAKVN
jgi:hypothetical protein